MATVIYCLQNMESKIAAKAMLGLSAAIALLYPFNAKFGYLSKLEVKCACSAPTASCAPTRPRTAAASGAGRRRADIFRSFMGRGGHARTALSCCAADPMHYVPEALMLGLTVAGVLALK